MPTDTRASSLFYKPTVLTSDKPANRLVYMKYGERLKYVRELRGLKQNQLSEFAGVAQGLISQLENSDTAGGSKYTAQIAAAMNISPTWLATGSGPMEPVVYQTTDAQIVEAMKIMENLDGQFKEFAIKALSDLLTCQQAARTAPTATTAEILCFPDRTGGQRVTVRWVWYSGRLSLVYSFR